MQTIFQLARAADRPMLAAAADLVDSDELKPQARRSLASFVMAIGQWREAKDSMPPADFARMVLDESGYTEMWQKDKSPDSDGRLENLKELVSAMEEFDTLSGFLNISLW